ncbi:hypothetical protein H9Q72_001825 [Fusarium xylarioides]|uniref:Uncharacterized protein n=1 Tax=Fusarium xylarioides TaxID=221167 RepID=A0A9P7LA02_9HYPO|nr:hypothetical protein H9Q72_001825 [Fusarium xylarioides]
MANTLTLSSAVVAGGPFEQQGSIDWVQIARMSVSVPISILRALGELKSFSAIGDVIWFGFGIKHIVRVLAETGKGLTCLTLCACLSEIHTPKACAEILIRLADVCDGPDDLRPSASQWINLVEACSGALRLTTFSCIAEQFMSFHRPYVRDDYTDEAGDVSKALLAVARVSSGVLSSVTLTGGRSCGWIAAIGFYFLGLEVEIRNADNASIYKSTADDEAIRLIVIYGTGQSSNQVEIRSAAYFIKSIDSVMSSFEQRFDSIISGAVPWDSCLSTTFGDSFRKLMDARQDFGRLMGAAARVFEALTNSDTGGIFSYDDCISWFGFQPGQYGHGFSYSATSLFPELLILGPCIDVETDMSVDDAVEAYNQASGELASTCNCHHCSRDHSRPMKRYCLSVLAETIIFLIWNVSALQLDADLKPYRSGLRFIYQLHSGRAMTDTGFGQRYGVNGHVAYWGDVVHLVRLLDLASVYHTAQFLFTNHLYPLQTHKAFTAASVGGICFYFDILRNVSDRPEEAMKLHVVPGVIQTNTGRQYPCIADKTGTRSRGLLGFDWGDYRSYSKKDATQHRTDYQASVTQTLGGNISIPILAMDTGSSDLKVKLLIEESTGGLLVDLYLCGSAGACRVGAYSMLKEIIENSGLVECHHRNCAQMDQISSPISVVDGEGCVSGNVQPRIYLRRLAGNPLARCVGLLVDREWNETPILRQRECIPCCIRTAANLRSDGQRSPSYVIL